MATAFACSNTKQTSPKASAASSYIRFSRIDPGRFGSEATKGSNSYKRTTETFRHYALDGRSPVVIHVGQSSDGFLGWPRGRASTSWIQEPARVSRFSHDPMNASSLPSDDIKSTGEDRSGTFWVASSEGLDAFDRTTGHVTLHIPLREAVREFSFHEDRYGTFWIISGSGNGLATFDRKTNQLTRYSFYSQEPADTGLTGVYAILENS